MKSRAGALILISVILAASRGVSPQAAMGAELRELYRGPRALGMGNAFTALADDEQAIFYNPAAMAGFKEVKINYVVVDLTTSTDVLNSYKQGTQALKKFNFESVSGLTGKRIYAQGSIVPSLTMPNFGAAILVDGQLALYGQNKALPQTMLGYQNTNGMQMAYGVAINRKRRSKGELRVGMAIKGLYRRGGYYRLPATTLIDANLSTLSQTVGNYELGYGGDLGTQYVYRLRKRTTLSAGLVYQNIGDVTFKAGTAPVKSNLSAGLAAQLLLGKMRFSAAYDYRHILDETDWRKKTHFGLEMGFPFLSIYGGVNQVYLTYGLTLDVWLARVTFVSYAEELGSFAYQDGNRRYMLQIALKF